LATPPP